MVYFGRSHVIKDGWWNWPHKASRFGCYANFTEEDCNKTVTIALEAWTVTGQLLQPSSKPVLIDCDAVDYVTPLESDVESDANVTIGEVESDDVSETSTDEQSTDSVS
jgi:hypothetical protein